MKSYYVLISFALICIFINGCSSASFFPRIYDPTFAEIHKNPDILLKTTTLAVSPNGTYKAVKAYKESLMAFSSGATVIGVYKNNKLIGEKFYNESFWGVDLIWDNNKTLSMYRIADQQSQYYDWLSCFKSNKSRRYGKEISLQPRISTAIEVIKLIYRKAYNIDVSQTTITKRGSNIKHGIYSAYYYIPSSKDSLQVLFHQPTKWKCTVIRNSEIIYQGVIPYEESSTIMDK